MNENDKKIYDYIVKYKTINGFSPSTYDIAEHCFYSRTYVRKVLHRLTEEGYIKYTPNLARSIVVTKFIS